MPQSSPVQQAKPRGNLAGFIKFFQRDFTSGLLVFLIALRLSMGNPFTSGRGRQSVLRFVWRATDAGL